MTLDAIVKQRVLKRADAEDDLYREQTGGSYPVSPSEIGISTALGTALAKGTSHVPGLWNKGNVPWGWGKSLGVTLSPAFMPWGALMEGGTALLNPLGDPKYRRGGRTYWASLKEGLRNSVQAYQQKGREATDRYGLLGYPVRYLHAINSPLTAALSATGVLDKKSSFRARLEFERALLEKG